MKLGKYLSSFNKLELEKIKAECIFSQEEIKIIEMTVNKNTIIEIADKLNISIATVERRTKEIKEKIKKNDNYNKIPVCEKLLLTLNEASEYSNIDIYKLEELVKRPSCSFVIFIDKKMLIKRKHFENFIENSLQL